MRVSFVIVLVSLLFVFSGCEKKDDKKSVPAGMKCGAGKCGANMFDGSSALDKKKKNILSQMREDDSRKTCVINAKTTKEVYECVRERDGKKLTTKCGDTNSAEPTMKCGSEMKCAAGKCG